MDDVSKDRRNTENALRDRRIKSPQDIEMESLEAHVVLCHTRYDGICNRLDKLEVKFDELEDVITSKSESLSKSIIAASGAIILSLLGLIATLYFGK
jgi:hypothetical protein